MRGFSWRCLITRIKPDPEAIHFQFSGAMLHSGKTMATVAPVCALVSTRTHPLSNPTIMKDLLTFPGGNTLKATIADLKEIVIRSKGEDHECAHLLRQIETLVIELENKITQPSNVSGVSAIKLSPSSTAFFVL